MDKKRNEKVKYRYLFFVPVLNYTMRYLPYCVRSGYHILTSTCKHERISRGSVPTRLETLDSTVQNTTEAFAVLRYTDNI